MKTLLIVARLLALGVGMMATAANAGQGSGAEAFEKLKALAGHWESTTHGPMKSTLDIEVTSNGTAVLERLHAQEKNGPVNMVNIYYLDGGQLKLTHYCMVGNQPTMRGTYSPDASTITFDFVAGTNLKSPNDGHMDHPVYTLIDNDHVKMAWTFQKDQKDAPTEEVEYVRAQQRTQRDIAKCTDRPGRLLTTCPFLGQLEIG
jgi:hypothetical protein